MVTVRFNHEQRVRSTANHRTVNAIFAGNAREAADRVEQGQSGGERVR